MKAIREEDFVRNLRAGFQLLSSDSQLAGTLPAGPGTG
jgi:hypothetical protein